jgi:ATP/maltotriose-dependent transcriptional regulator MalT
LLQLDGEDLRFRSWEVEQLFRAVYAAPLSPEAAAALTRRTGGWAAGLQLFHLATSQLSRTERERAVDELSGRSRLIRSYLTRNVLDGLEPERRRFLLLTSTLGVLTGDICDALLDTHGSAAALSELEREQLFTTSTDAGLTYHYHQVLQTHLEVVLVDELGGRAARELYSRSAELLEQAGWTAAAIRAHARAEDWGSVARLLKPDSLPLAGDEALWGLLSLPGAPTDDPGLVLAGARRLARHGRIADAITAFRHAEALLDDPEFRRRCAMERSAAAVWLPHAALPPMPSRYEADSDSTLLRYPSNSASSRFRYGIPRCRNDHWYAAWRCC